MASEHAVAGSAGGPDERWVETSVDRLSAEQVRRVYDELLVPAFRPAELLSPDDLREAGDESSDAPSAVVLDSDGTPVAVMLAERYVKGAALLLSYLAVDGRSRGRGLGSHLLREVLPRWCGAATLVVAEVDDPRAWPADDQRGDPRARLRFYGRHGARLVPLIYLQPALVEGGDRVQGMLLLRLDEAPGVEAHVLAGFLREYFTACEGPQALDDPTLSAVVEAAARLDLERDLWSVDRWEAIPQRH